MSDSLFIILLIVGLFSFLGIIGYFNDRRRIKAADVISKRLKSDTILYQIENVFHGRSCGDLYITQEQLIYIPLSYVDTGALFSPTDLIGGIVGEAIYEKTKEARKKSQIEALLSVAQKAREKAKKISLPELIGKQLESVLFEKSDIKDVEIQNAVLDVTFINPKAKPVIFVLKDNESSSSAKDLMAKWLK